MTAALVLFLLLLPLVIGGAVALRVLYLVSCRLAATDDVDALEAVARAVSLIRASLSRVVLLYLLSLAAGFVAGFAFLVPRFALSFFAGRSLVLFLAGTGLLVAAQMLVSFAYDLVVTGAFVSIWPAAGANVPPVAWRRAADTPPPHSCKIVGNLTVSSNSFAPGVSHDPVSRSRRAVLRPVSPSFGHELLALRRAGGDSTDGARVRRERDRASRQGVGRGPDVSARDDAQAGRPRNAGRARAGGVRRRGPDVYRLHPRDRGAVPRGRLGGPFGRGAQQPLHEPPVAVRKRGAAPRVGDAARAGEAPRSLGPHGGRSGQRQRRDAHDGRSRRRRVGAERREDVHHARLRRRRRGAHGGDGQGGGQARHLGVRRRPSPEGRPRGQEGEQARHEGVRHGDDRAGGLPDSEGQPPRRGGSRASFRR